MKKRSCNVKASTFIEVSLRVKVLEKSQSALEKNYSIVSRTTECLVTCDVRIL